MATAAKPLLAGLDLGGTKIGICLGDRQGHVLAADRVDTDPGRAPEELLAECFARLNALQRDLGVPPPQALGVASPGPLSYAEGRLLEVPNMPRWQLFGLREWLDQHVSIPAEFMNDANAGVVAEVYWGAAQGADTAVFLTMSTGMGAGLWLNGRVFEGPLALAGEIGHIRLHEDGPVGFGKRGSVEGYLSGPGMVQVAAAEVQAARQRGGAPNLSDAAITPERICALAGQGDTAALAVIDRCGAELGRLCAVLVDLLNPDVIVLGTIGTAAFGLWEPRARAVIDAEALTAAANHVRLAPSGLTDRGDQTALAIARRVLEAQDSR